MKKLLIRLSAAILVFIVATALTKVYYRFNVQFRSEGVGSMGMCENGHGGFTSYTSYDGEKLAFSSIRFPTTEDARKCFESSLEKGNFTILDREQLLDNSGTVVVGERIVGKNADDPTNAGFVFSLDENSTIEIGSTSLRHALIFEKQARKY